MKVILFGLYYQHFRSLTSESPLGGNRRNSIELVVLSILVPHEVIADFYFRAYAEIDAFPAAERVEVVPELRFAQQNPFSARIGVVP